MGSVFQKMVDDEVIIINPVRKVKKLQVIHKEKRILNITEIRKILKIAKVDYPDFYPVLFTAINTGMRRGDRDRSIARAQEFWQQ